MFRDDFENRSDAWIWRTDGIAGFELQNSVLRMWIGPTEALYYSNAEIADGEFDNLRWSYATFEARIRFPTVDRHLGSAGWGFWNHSMRLDQCIPMWFIYLRAYGNYILQGFFVQLGTVFMPIKLLKPIPTIVKLGQFIKLSPIIFKTFKPVMQDLDLSKWHIYKVEWKKNSVKFFIDGTEIASIAMDVDKKMRTDVWIDNAVFIPSKGPDKVYRHVTQEVRTRSFIEVDWIEIS